MKIRLLKITKIIIFFLILIIALLVRKRKYAEIPIPGQSVDEYSYAWVGLSLIESGMPIGISGIDGYKNRLPRYINVDRFFQTVSSGDPLIINYPWMDHPPLLGLITGGFAFLNGTRVFEDATSYVIRKPIIVISTLSVALLMIFCWINFGFLSAVIGGLIYSTTPLVVLSSRMIQAENGIIPCFLACMICISLYMRSKKDVWLILAGFSAGVASLFKLTGFTCHLFVLLALLNNSKRNGKLFLKDFIFFLAISLPISFLFVIYGSVYGINNFIQIFFSNYNRFYGIGPNSIIELIRNQRLTQHKYLPEISIISGWLVFFGYVFNKEKNRYVNLVILGNFSYLIIYIFFGSQPYGWYSFPFWPLLSILLSVFISDGLSKNKNIIAVFFSLILIFGTNISRLIGIFDFQPYANIWRFSISVLFFILVSKLNNKKYINFASKLLLVLILMAIIYTNISYLNMINIDYWWQNIS